MEEATLISWRKRPGESVEKDEILFEMETDKVVLEVPAAHSGVLLRIDVAEGVAGLDEPVAWIGSPGEELPTPFVRRGRATAHIGPLPPQENEKKFSPGVAASPAARRLARELGLDLKSIQGTGPGGRVTEADVHRARGTS